jgi:hypothetical protein
MQNNHKFCTLGRLAAEVGWKHGPTVAALEEKRLVRSADYYKLKKKGVMVSISQNQRSFGLTLRIFYSNTAVTTTI